MDLTQTTKMIFDWLRSQPLLLTLFVLNFLDIFSGLCGALIRGDISSKASMRGMTKKVFIWIVIGCAATVDKLTPKIPEMKIAALFYIAPEALSILENAVIIGLPVPPQLRAALVETQKWQMKSGKEKAGNAKKNSPDNN